MEIKYIVANAIFLGLLFSSRLIHQHIKDIIPRTGETLDSKSYVHSSDRLVYCSADSDFLACTKVKKFSVLPDNISSICKQKVFIYFFITRLSLQD
jgi:hypothetical protein